MNIKDLRLASGMERTEFAEYFNIPYRTLQNWELGTREAPEYLIELIEYKIKKEGLNMKKLVVMDHGEKTELFEGTLEEIVEYLKKNEDVYNWQLDEDANAEQPELDEAYDWEDLEREFDRISLGWWDLVLEDVKSGKVKEQLNILRNGEYLTMEEFIEEVENADAWDEIEVEDYRQALKDVGLDYDDYDDPDMMWEDFLSKVK